MLQAAKRDDDHVTTRTTRPPLRPDPATPTHMLRAADPAPDPAGKGRDVR